MSIYQPIDAIVQVKEKGQPRQYIFPTLLNCTTCHNLMGIQMTDVGNDASAWQLDRHPLQPLRPHVPVHNAPLAFACYLIFTAYSRGTGGGKWDMPACLPCTCHKKDANWKNLDLSHVINDAGMLAMGASACATCHLATKAQWSDRSAEEQWIISMLNHGEMLHRFDNAPPSTGICQCHGELAQLREMIESNLPEIEDDTGWNVTDSSIRRGICDYRRTVIFETDLTASELKVYEKFLAMDKCPGWTGILTRRQGVGVYIFGTTMDSSD